MIKMKNGELELQDEENEENEECAMEQINYEEEHRKLWNWLADHPGSWKSDYFEDWGYDSIPRSYCFACEVAYREAYRANSPAGCRFCPLGGPRIVGCDDGLYAEWWATASHEDRRQLAHKIANLPWKEKEND